ncbi:MAG TPA: L,D-transpeptidase [Acidimicrobiales bacterium]|nr:L,D-transpeptidase [Acidimicrobiales bacterium]
MAALALLVGVVAALSAGWGSDASAPEATHPATAPAAPAAPAAVDPALTPPPGTTLTATTNGAIAGYPAPGLPSNMIVPASFYGYPSILPVIATQPGWLEVRLAQRPNGSTTWVQQSDVTLGNTPYFISISLTTMHLTVYQDGVRIFDFAAGVGAPDDPTPPGQYFVFGKVPPPSAAYGPFVLATSDHSDTITDWENSGDAIIGIHGPITSYDDSRIGSTGAAISHGCIRLHDADLAQLAMIPAGTPIDIVS